MPEEHGSAVPRANEMVSATREYDAFENTVHAAGAGKGPSCLEENSLEQVRPPQLPDKPDSGLKSFLDGRILVVVVLSALLIAGLVYGFGISRPNREIERRIEEWKSVLNRELKQHASVQDVQSLIDRYSMLESSGRAHAVQAADLKRTGTSYIRATDRRRLYFLGGVLQSSPVIEFYFDEECRLVSHTVLAEAAGL
jgi:hypothetical protein